MDPFANTVADYNSLMGNTGGDNRAEFDWRMDHAVWYESPIWKGFQFSAMVSPGQNYRRALALRPDMPQACTNLGVALQHQGKLDEAVAAFRQAIAGNPKHADAYFNLGAVLRVQNHVDEAAAAYRRVIELDPSHAAACNNLALILSEAGELRAADALQRQAVGQQADYAEGHNNLGAILLDQGRPQEALDALRAALKLKPDYPEAYLNMVRCANWAAWRRRSTPTGAPSNCGRLMPRRSPSSSITARALAIGTTPLPRRRHYCWPCGRTRRASRRSC